MNSKAIQKPIDPLIDVNEVGQIIGMSISSVRRLTKLGKLPQPVRIGLNSVRWKQSEILAFVDAL